MVEPCVSQGQKESKKKTSTRDVLLWQPTKSWSRHSCDITATASFIHSTKHKADALLNFAALSISLHLVFGMWRGRCRPHPTRSARGDIRCTIGGLGCLIWVRQVDARCHLGGPKPQIATVGPGVGRISIGAVQHSLRVVAHPPISRPSRRRARADMRL